FRSQRVPLWWRQVMDRVVGDSGRFDIAALFRRRPRPRRRAEEPAQHFADDAHYDDHRYDQDGRDSAALHQQDYEAEQSAWAASARAHRGSPRERLGDAQAAGSPRHSVPTDQQGWDEPPREEAYDLDEVQAPVVVRRQPLRDDERASQAAEDVEPASEAEV